MQRTKLSDRMLPDYTVGEENFNFVSHAAGVILGILVLVLCLIRSVGPWAVVSSAIYGVSMILLYAVSASYHGLRKPLPKKVMQVIDHCTIYLLICGSYTPILLCSLRLISPVMAWALFGAVWGLAVLATVFTAIDLKKYAKFSMCCYLGMGWCAIFSVKSLIKAVPVAGLLWLLAGGIAYTVGAVLYGLGKKHRYMHSVFHLFVLAGSILQFVCIYKYVI